MVLKMTHCLICYTNCNLTLGTNDASKLPGGTINYGMLETQSLISKQLETIFILRKLFEVPVTHLEVFLHNEGNPEDWISLCGTCKESTERARKIYEEILEAKEKFREIRKDIAATVRSTFQWPIRKNGSSFVSVVDECRRLLKDHTFDKGKKSFVDGDQQADEHLKRFKFKCRNILVEPKIEGLDNIEHSVDLFNSSPLRNSISEPTCPEDPDPDFYPSDNDEYHSIDSSGEGDEENRSIFKESSKTTNNVSPKRKGYRKNVRQFKCAHCSATFLRQATLDTHVKHRHSSSTSSNREIEKEVGNSDEKFCSQCHLTFASQYSLYKHVKNIHLRKRKYACPICYRGYLSVSACIKHISDMHKESDMTDEEKEKVRKIMEAEAGKGNQETCPLCNKKCSLISFYSHVKKDHPDFAWSAPSVENEAFTLLKAKFKENIKLYSKGNFVCDTCGENFTTKPGLTKHFRFQHEKKFDVSCDICGKGMRGDFQLRFHLARAHKIGTVSIKRTCTFEGCRRACWTLEEFEDHLSTHTKTPRHQCNQCGVMIYTKNNLRQHQKTHLANRPRPFPCKICGKKFSHKSYLPYHLKTHDTQKNQKRKKSPKKENQIIENVSAAGGQNEHSESNRGPLYS